MIVFWKLHEALCIVLKTIKFSTFIRNMILLFHCQLIDLFTKANILHFIQKFSETFISSFMLNVCLSPLKLILMKDFILLLLPLRNVPSNNNRYTLNKCWVNEAWSLRHFFFCDQAGIVFHKQQNLGMRFKSGETRK